MNKYLKWFLVAALLIWSTVCFGASQQTSSTTAATIIDRIEARLNDSGNRMWSAGDLLTWLNEAQLDIVTRTHCLESTETETLVADQVEYPLSTFDGTVTYITIKAVWYIDSDSKGWALQRGSPSMVGQSGEDQGGNPIPQYWYEFSGSIGVYPALSAIDAGTAETIKIYYITRPTAIATTDNLTIPSIYEPALIYYVLAQAYLRDNQLSRYLQTISIYEREMARIRVDLNEMVRVVE